MRMDKSFTKEEFRHLLFLTFLGEWVVNAHRGADSLPEYSNLMDKMLGYAHKFGLDEYVTWEKEPGKIGPSSLLEDECRTFMAEYEDKFFADELSERLSQIDVEDLVRYQKERPDFS